jgi:glycerate kinase
MRFVIAPDKFKGSLEAAEVAAALAAGLTRELPDAEIEQIPVADGGEGTVEAALNSGFEALEVAVEGPVGNPVRATIGLRGSLAVIEMAAASGLGALPVAADGRPQLDALRASSAGTGQLITAALDAGATEIVLGVGGSANTDGGAGLLTALGARLLDEHGEAVRPGGGGLRELASVSLDGLDPRLAGTRFVLAADVTNPLLGATGAAAVFGPQKGAGPDDVAILDQALGHYARLVADTLRTDVAALVEAEGAGAAGGVGFAALAVLQADRRPGIDVVLDLVRLDERLPGADVVITGEGSLDAQSLGGKTPIGVARRARAHDVPLVLAVCGRSLISAEEGEAAGFDAIHALSDREPDPARSMAQAAALLTQLGADLGADLGRRLAHPAEGGPGDLTRLNP